MIRENLKKIFVKNDNNNGQQSLDKRHMNITPFVEDIAKLLVIELPKIESWSCLFLEDGQIQTQREFRRDELPEDTTYYRSFYFDKRNLIVIARKYLRVDLGNGIRRFRNKASAEQLFDLAHELRHVWQKTYHEDVYYEKNAIQLEVIRDKAEIDADAFAFSYVFSDRTPFTWEDFPNLAEEIVLYATLDEGERWSRTAELAGEYGFKTGTKLEDLKNNVDGEKIAAAVQLIAVEKLQRRYNG